MDQVLTNLVGIPWELGGRSAEGADCFGLFLLAQELLFGRKLQAPWTYGAGDYLQRALELPEKLGLMGFSPARGKPVEGDAILLEMGGALHLGTVIRGRWLTTLEGRGSFLGHVPVGRRTGLYRFEEVEPWV